MSRGTFYEVGYNGKIISCAYAEEYCQEANALRIQLSAAEARVKYLEEVQEAIEDFEVIHNDDLNRISQLEQENTRLREGLNIIQGYPCAIRKVNPTSSMMAVKKIQRIARSLLDESEGER